VKPGGKVAKRLMAAIGGEAQAAILHLAAIHPLRMRNPVATATSTTRPAAR
jgi:hypothetical protein